MNSPLYLTCTPVTHNTYIPSVTSQGLQDAVSEMETGVQEVYWGALLGLAPVGEGRKQMEDVGLQCSRYQGFSGSPRSAGARRAAELPQAKARGS